MTTDSTINVLYYSPGQKASIFLETLDGDGLRADGYIPVVTRVIFPDLTLAENFPQNMVKLDIGLYFFQFTLPVTGSSIGSYLVDVLYNKPGTMDYFNTLYQLVVNAPFGMYSVTTQ